jgi:uncharacterized protein YndB with AHSA1/START domain
MNAQDNSKMKSINQQAPVSCSKSISIHATKEKVWAAITNINDWTRWQSDIPTAQLMGSLQVGSSFYWKTGGAKIHSTLHTVEAYRHFGWTGNTFGIYAIHNWTLNESNNTITVTVDESMEGWLATLFKKTFNKNLEQGMQNWLALLKQECER